MISDRVFVSFWHICLDNLPGGTYRNTLLTSSEAKLIIDIARDTAQLTGVSNNDLYAPFEISYLNQHRELIKVLDEHYDIKMYLKDFVVERNLGADTRYSTFPLNLIRVSPGRKLIVIDAYSEMVGPPQLLEEYSGYCVVPDTVRFYLFESLD